MSAAEALKAARAADIKLAIDGDDLVLEASAPPPSAILEVLSRHKAEIVAVLRPGRDGWSAEDWLLFFEERAGIAEFDGGLPRTEAEADLRDGRNNHVIEPCPPLYKPRNRAAARRASGSLSGPMDIARSRA
jgi:hypothetical protein